MSSVIRGSDNFDSAPPANCQIRLANGNGFGSSATKIRRYSTVVENSGGDRMIYADSPTNGGSITILKPGRFAIDVTDSGNAATYTAAGISKNSN